MRKVILHSEFLSFYTMVFLWIIVLCGQHAFALSPITINSGNLNPVPIAINQFEASGIGTDLANQIRQVIEDDLNNSMLFQSIPNNAFIENKVGAKQIPHFASWKQINANWLINATFFQKARGQVELQLVLWDIVSGKAVLSESLRIKDSSSWRRVAHMASDKIYEKITGEPGYFDTQIAYVTIGNKGNNTTRKQKNDSMNKIAIMDFDGNNFKYLIVKHQSVSTPRFSSTGNQLLYLGYENLIPQVFLMDLKTHKVSKVGKFQGMTFAPRFSPDNNKVILSATDPKNGSINIYEHNLNTHTNTQLTNDIAINTSPTYSPDGSAIYFNSNISGTSQIYVMNSNGSNVRRISFGEGSYRAPVCSPNGAHIVFVKITQDLGFALGVMQNDGSNERIIATGNKIDSPTWSPNGRKIIYNKVHKLQNYLYEIDITGLSERRVSTPDQGVCADWAKTM